MTQLANRWVEIFRSGSHTDSEGRSRVMGADFLEAVVAQYDAALHEAPVVVGHPADNGPAWGWAKRLRVRDGRLEAEFGEVDAQFEQMVLAGRFKKRSASFYLDPATAPGGRAPYLRHVGFLGAQPPAIKGLRDIQFSEGESLTFEIDSIQFSEDETMDEKQQESLVQKIIAGFKSAFSGPGKEGAPANFTEADLNAKIAAAVTTATASFGEKITALETKNQTLQTQLDSQVTKTAHGELAQFVESLGQAKLPLALRAGLVEFLETLPDAGDRKVTVVEFSEKDGNKVETKTEMSPLGFMKKFLVSLGPFINFGEQFGGIIPAGSDDAAEITPERRAQLRAGAGLPALQGGK